MSKETLFEKLKKSTKLIKEGKITLSNIEEEEILIENCNENEELNHCLNSNELNPKFKHLIMKRFLQIE